jgi:hypothetical protein
MNFRRGIKGLKVEFKTNPREMMIKSRNLMSSHAGSLHLCCKV